MASFLVLYATGEGQTEKVASRIAETVRERGHDVTTVNAEDRPADLALDAFDAVLVGASIHGGRQQASVRSFVASNRETLAAKPTAFFQVSMSSRDDARAEEAASYVEAFVEETGWHPDRIGLFGGALRYSEYGFLKQLVMKQVAKQEFPDVSTSEDVEFTDWAEVEAFAADVASFVEGRLGVAPPGAAETGEGP